MANKIPSLNKVLPESPDQIQRFSSESSAALARMSHVNRAAQYFGMSAEFIELDYNTGNVVYINKPCGHIHITNAGLGVNDTIQLIIVWDSSLYNASPEVSTPFYAQFTGSGITTPCYITSTTNPADAINANILVTIFSAGAADSIGFFYSIVPQ